jgi:hypothetical protein
MTWNPPRKYKGFRTTYTHAIKVTIPYPERISGRSLYAMGANDNSARLAEMEDWCEEFCRFSWSSMGYCTWYFDKMQEAIMFKMLFGGK